jgi:hypothetical protein
LALRSPTISTAFASSFFSIFSWEGVYPRHAPGRLFAGPGHLLVFTFLFAGFGSFYFCILQRIPYIFDKDARSTA